MRFTIAAAAILGAQATAPLAFYHGHDRRRLRSLVKGHKVRESSLHGVMTRKGKHVPSALKAKAFQAGRLQHTTRKSGNKKTKSTKSETVDDDKYFNACDPNSDDSDTGVLSCGDLTCVPSEYPEYATLGGYCLQECECTDDHCDDEACGENGLCFPYGAGGVCYTYSGYNYDFDMCYEGDENSFAQCDCDNFDEENDIGTYTCALNEHCMGSEEKQVCYSGTMETTWGSDGSFAYDDNICLGLTDGLLGYNSFCYRLEYSDGKDSCEIKVDGVACQACKMDEYGCPVLDCTNIPSVNEKGNFCYDPIFDDLFNLVNEIFYEHYDYDPISYGYETIAPTQAKEEEEAGKEDPEKPSEAPEKPALRKHEEALEEASSGASSLLAKGAVAIPLLAAAATMAA